MRVLMTAASKHGATIEVAEQSAAALRNRGVQTAAALAARPTWLFSSGPLGHAEGIARALQAGLAPS